MKLVMKLVSDYKAGNAISFSCRLFQSMRKIERKFNELQ